MSQLDNTPSNPNEPEKAARAILRSVTDDLKTLQGDFSDQLSQDITRLQGTKHRLLNDIAILEEEYQSLQSQYETLKASHDNELSRKQLVQQQVWAKRLAQAIATQLQSRLTETIYNTASIGGSGPADSLQQAGSLPNAYQLLASLDASLNDTLQSLQQDLNSYQSSLSQQINRMQSMEQQGEAILEALLNRLSLQLQTQMTRPQSQQIAGTPNSGQVDSSRYLQGYPDSIAPQRYGLQPSEDPRPSRAYPEPTASSYQQLPVATGAAPNRSMPPPNRTQNGSRATSTTTSAPSPQATPERGMSTFQKGMIFIILSTVALSTHNVLVGIIGFGGMIFGRLPVSEIFALDIPNSLMLLWSRMVVVLLPMVLLASSLYANVWSDIRQFLTAEDKRPILQVIASGFFLFMSQVLIYKAISEIGPGVAVTLLFMYPLITVPLAWFLFGDRPTPLRTIVMFAITMGVVFVAYPYISADLSGGNVSPWGVVMGLISSGTFALYLIAMQLSFRKLHPVPVSLVQFMTIFVLASTVLIVGSFFGLEPTPPSSRVGLVLGAIFLGVLTLLGYLFNNYGVRLMGAAQASIVASTGPVLTAIMARLINPVEKSMLHYSQWIGVIFVTLGVIALSAERLNRGNSPKPKRIRT